MAKHNLPIEAHDHFGKAKRLHDYVMKDLSSAASYAYECGVELLAAKKLVPHGRWESVCASEFDGSLRTAQSYMRLAKHMNRLPKVQRTGLLYLEKTIDGAARVAKQLAKGKQPTVSEEVPTEPEVIDAEFETVEEEQPEETRVAHHSDDTAPLSKPPKKYDRKFWLKQWDQHIGPLVRLVDKIANNVEEARCDSHVAILDQLQYATDEMEEWMGK